jgi:hypothetical protein
MRVILLATTAAAAIALGSGAWAASDNNSMQNGTKARDELTQMLQKSGYTDIRVASTSFMARAKDRDGNPVMMSISPDHFTEMTAMNEGSDRSKTERGSHTVGSSNGSDTYVNAVERRSQLQGGRARHLQQG